MEAATEGMLGGMEMPGAQGNHGLLVEPQQRLAFIACEGNDKLLVLDMRTRRVISSFDIGQDPDVLAFDSQLHLLYVAGEAGIASMFKAEAGRASKIGDDRIRP